MKDTVIIKTANTSHDIHPHLAERWSPRAFAQKEVSQQQVDQLLEAARWAASSMNAQPWRFIYAFKGTAAYDKIFELLGDFNQKWAGTAPVLMLTAIKEKFDDGKDNYHALHDLGLAMGNMSMQAQSMGLALHQMAGVDWKKAQEVYQTPEHYHIATAVAIGYYGGALDQLPEDLQEQELAERSRKPLEDIAAEGEWKDRF